MLSCRVDLNAECLPIARFKQGKSAFCYGPYCRASGLQYGTRASKIQVSLAPKIQAYPRKRARLHYFMTKQIQPEQLTGGIQMGKGFPSNLYLRSGTSFHGEVSRGLSLRRSVEATRRYVT